MDDQTLLDQPRADDAGSDDAPLSGMDEFRASVADARAKVRAFLGSGRGVKLQLLGDVIALVPLVAMLVWMSSHDGAHEPQFRRYVTGIALAASPLAVAELRALGRWPRRLVTWWYVGLLLVWALAGERNFWVPASIPLVLTPALGLYAHRIWRRPWGPLALFGLLLLSLGAFFYGGFLSWWGDTLRGRIPLFRPLSWHNQSGALMGAFGAAFLGAAYAARSSIAAVSVLAAAAGLGTVWLAGSRGALVATGVGLAIVTVAALRGVAWRRVVATLALTAAGAGLVVLGLTAMERPDAVTGSEAGVPGAIPTERVTQRTLAPDQSLERRLQHADAAFGMFVDRPIGGQGIGSYQVRALEHTDPTARLTSSAHNEYVEVLGEGGLLFGLPFLGLHLLVGAAALRRRITPDEGPRERPDVRAVACASGIGLVTVIGLHAAIDFDWFYPILPTLLAIGAVLVGGRVIPDTERAPRRVLWAGVPLVLALGLVVAGDIAESRANRLQPDLTAQQFAEVPLPWQAERALPIALDLARSGEHDLAQGLMSEVVAWNPAVDEYGVLLDSLRYRAGEISPQDLVLSLADSSAQFRAFNLVAEALIDEGDIELARGVLDAVMERYDDYANWGVGGVRAESWYLIVRADAEAGDCRQAAEHTAEAVESGAYAPELAELELEPLVADCGAGAG